MKFDIRLRITQEDLYSMFSTVGIDGKRVVLLEPRFRQLSLGLILRDGMRAESVRVVSKVRGDEED
jgi:hypothetical protein